ncbi:MAG: metallophosphoesterase [Bacteroidota bacterium]|nr:metallophosphoesterase [Bacteroidota bacterium]
MKQLFFTLLLSFIIFNVTSQVTLVKGPYLQIGTPNSMVIRWETNIASNSRVTYGTSSLALTSTVNVAASVTSHSVLITGLSAFTKYYYSVGNSTTVIQQGADNYFVTSPVPGTPGNYRFWVTGDCGNGSTNQTNCKNQYLTYNGNNITHGWLLLGDNAYSNGTNAEYDTKFFNYYETDIMKKAVLWPAPGNHDYNNGASTATNVPYYSIFSMPTAGQAGGLASGTPAYYSYDYGNIHFISLDSYGTVGSNKMYDTLGAQALWLKADLAANTKRWTIAYWHHPPYTMGSHNSDFEFFDLGEVRSKFIRILESRKVDLILCGHSHDYERSKLMKGHYGLESSFNAGTHNLSTQSGAYDGSANSCPYIKDSINAKNGTVYVVSGSAGQLGSTQAQFPHNAMHYSSATHGGSFILDIQDNRLDAKWLCADGVIRDKFTIYKDVNSVKIYTVTPTATTNISASWPGTYVWSNAATTNSISVTTSVNTTYWVKDPNNCVADTFKFVVNIPTGVETLFLGNNTSIKIYPNPNNGAFSIDLNSNEMYTIEVFNIVGQLIHHSELQPGNNLIQLKAVAGMYQYNILKNANPVSKGKIIVQ